MRSFDLNTFHAVQVCRWPPAFSLFLAGRCFGVLLFLWLFAWMRTAILAGGIAVVRSGCVVLVCLAEDSDLVNDFLFICDWIIRSDSV